MDLTSKLGKGLRTGILTTSLGLASLTGCAAFEEAFKETEGTLLEQVIWQAGAAKARERGEFEKAQAMENIGLIRGNIAAAKARRSEVNVNVDTNRGRRTQLPENVVLSDGNYNPAQGYTWINPEDNNDLRVRKKQSINYARQIQNSVKQSIVDENFKNSTGISDGKFYYFAANYYKDFDENRYSSPNEFVGIKDKFREDEKLILVSYDKRSGLKGYEGEMEIYSPNGNIISIINIQTYTYDYNRGNTKVFGLESRAPLMNFLVEKGGYGNYKVVWKLDGKYDGSNEFEIVPSLRNKEATKE